MSLFHEDRLLIDGELVRTDRTFETVDPSTGKVLGTASDAEAAHAEAAVAAARRAFDTTDWMRDGDLRLRCLRQLYEALLRHREELRELTIAEVGAPRSLTHGSQLDEPIEIVKWYADLLEGYDFREELPIQESRGRRHRRWVEKEAAGVVAAILPYNFPNQLALAKLAPALAAGCTVVLKGAPDTPWTTLALGRIIAEETDIPAGVVNVLTSSGTGTGELLTTHPGIDMITFTGSTPVGRAVMAAASATLKRVFLELGGKSAMLVLDDADFTQAAMMAAFTVCTHAGQGCGITSRLLVPRERHDEAVQLVTAMLGRVAYGDPADPATHMGPLISERQRAKVHGLVERAVADGARLVTGGRPVDREGYFYAPTLLADVDPRSEIAQEEIFGPVLVVIPYDDEDGAVRIANDSMYGLSGAVLSADDERAIAVARRIRSGSFSINGGLFFGPDSPFGGFKQSGIGREMGVAGLEEFLELKTFGVAEK
ncbi:aldehyde dehydrogenase family protein [Streptomyces sp. GESEQ-35]|uniref:aldehyde dehydrogenase family protein n=1 Tax=Streptomyces sp. GESEQ-35 TaxID=2812657 RepID=UPI001B33E4BB|nr:aldehyde dehydrogenase family protein [Streptomyces sp. GESEQ-35]